VIKKLIAMFMISAVTIIPLRTALAGDNGPSRGGTMQLRLGELVLGVTQASENRGYVLKFSKGREDLFDCECAFKTHEPRTFPHTPFHNCSTLLAYCFSGGAHCCTTLFIATECCAGGSLDMVDLGHSVGEVEFVQADGAPGKAMEVHDWQFAYYGPENSEIQLPFAYSPAMTRLLVFDNGHWRADRAGEFSRFYSRLLRQTVNKARISERRRQTELTASLAIKAAYYDLMSGKPVEEVSEVLNRLFPKRWKSDSAKIIQDVCRAASEFDPVETIR
jgi:hypothetical protein